MDEDVPTFQVTLRLGQFTFQCPTCGRRHYHGAIEGHRIVGCKCLPSGCVLKLADADKTEGGEP